MQQFTPFHRQLSTLLFTGVFIILFTACDQTNVTPSPVIEPPLVALNYDDDNLTAPLLPGNTFEAAVKFTSSETSEVKGGKLIEVYYYLLEEPASCAIKVYQKSEANGPGVLLYSEVTTSEMSPQSWNKHTLSTPVDIGDEDIWIAVRVQHTQDQQTIGCDPGPAHPNGDWLFDSADGRMDKNERPIRK